MPKIFTIGRNLTKLWQKNKFAQFFGTRCIYKKVGSSIQLLGVALVFFKLCFCSILSTVFNMTVQRAAQTSSSVQTQVAVFQPGGSAMETMIVEITLTKETAVRFISLSMWSYFKHFDWMSTCSHYISIFKHWLIKQQKHFSTPIAVTNSYDSIISHALLFLSSTTLIFRRFR